MVLLVDGDNLLTIGFHGQKNRFYKGIHIGGIYHFINTLRIMFDEYRLEKIVVFWDGEDGAIQRKRIYHPYKESRSKQSKSEEELNSYNYQRSRVKMYLEEIYVRQEEFEFCESDDCIAYYTQNSDENIIIFSGDGDLVQLVNDRVSLYDPKSRKVYKKGGKISYKHFEIPIENVILLKMLCGDASDNIAGIKNVGLKRLLLLFPEILERPTTIEEIINKGNILNKEKENWILTNILTGVTKHGILGEEFFRINKQITFLDEPFLTDEAKEGVISLINENIDSEGRSYKNAMKLMMEDGIHMLLPKYDSAWVNFLTPFLKLTRKEKNKRTIKIRNNG